MANPPLPPPGQLVDVGAGRRLHMMALGEGRPTVVFESGGGGGSAMQDRPAQRLVSAFARAVIYDRAGLGWSDKAEPGRSFTERAEDLFRLLEAARLPGPYVLVGGSFGGLMARAFAYSYPDEVAGMVLLDAAEEEKYFPIMARMRARHEAEWKAEAERAANGELRRGAEPMIARSRAFTDEEKPWLLDVLSRPGHFLAAVEELTAIDATPASMKVAGGFGGLGDKPLIVLSADKPMTGELAVWQEGAKEAQGRLAALSTNSVHVVGTGLGHSIALERPALVAAAVAAVIGAVKGGPLDVGEVRRLAADPRAETQ